jgi:hypothetical protein
MDGNPKSLIERRSLAFRNLVFRFFVKYNEAVAFIAGWSAYPIGMALLALLGK